MPTETLPIRTPTQEKLSTGFAVALTLHGLAFAGIIAAAWIGHNSHWGDTNRLITIRSGRGAPGGAS